MPLWRAREFYMTYEDFDEWCANCLLHKDDHAEQKCLYAPTSFEPITDVQPGRAVPEKYRSVLVEFNRRRHKENA